MTNESISSSSFSPSFLRLLLLMVTGALTTLLSAGDFHEGLHLTLKMDDYLNKRKT